MNGRRALGTGLAVALTAGAAWFGIAGATADGEQVVTGSDQVEFRGWPGKAVNSAERAQRLANQAHSLTVLTKPERGRSVDVGRKGWSVGDFFLFEETLYNPNRAHRVIGKDAIRCERGIRTFNCEGTVKLDGRGKITVFGAFMAESDNAIAVTGGTKDFSGVGGELHVYDLRGGKSLLVLDLVR